jgi:hypothetical protein
MKPGILAASAFFLAAGIGWKWPSRTADVEPPAAGQPSKASNREVRNARRYGPPDAVRQRMERIRRADGPERMRETIDLVNSLPVGELGRWLDRGWFAAGDGYEGKVFELLAKERWKREDPEGYAAWGLKSGNGGRDLLAEWARNDPGRMMDFFRKHPAPSIELRFWGISTGADSASAMTRLLEVAKLGALDSNRDNWEVEAMLKVIGKGDAALLERHLRDLPVSWQQKAERAMSAIRLEADFDGEVARLMEQPDGWMQLKTGLQQMENPSEAILKVLEDFPASWKASLAENPGGLVNDPRWLDADLEAVGFTREQASAILTEAMRMAVYSQPEKVLGGLHAADLTDEQRTRVLASLFHAGSDPKGLQSMLDQLGTPELRQQAEAMMQPLPVTAAGTAPEVQGTWMERAGTQGSAIRGELLAQAADWNDATAAAMVDEFKRLPEVQRQVAANVILEGQGYVPHPGVNPAVRGEAIRFLIGGLEKVDEGGRASAEARQAELAAAHAAIWVTEDPRAAGDWVLSLPAGQSREAAVKYLAETWKRYDPDASASWVSGLPASDRAAMEKFR